MKKFSEYETHPWLKKVYGKLTAQDLKCCLSFLDENVSLDKGEFELAVNRMFLDREKPKNFPIILELLTCCNSS